MSYISLFLLLTLISSLTESFQQLRIQKSIRSLLNALPSKIDLNGIEEAAALAILDKIETVELRLPSEISDEPIPSTFVQYKALKPKKKLPPLVLLHGFDSSCVEFRRLAPVLQEYADVYVPDVLGWGFSDTDRVKDFSPKAKLAHLEKFIREVVCKGGVKKCVLVGASLGGTMAINLAADVCPDLVSALVLIDAQGTIDGKGPSTFPDFIARFGVNVLRSEPLRMYANYIAYSDKTLASKDAMNIGRLHCQVPEWERASVAFVQSGGFFVRKFVPLVSQKTLVLWGTEDKIISPDKAQELMADLKNAQLTYIPDCGHVPHLEKPRETSALIRAFLDQLR